MTMSLAFTAFSKQVEGLYEARVVVPSQSIESRKEGAKQGLADVLYKVSGFPVPVSHPVIEHALSIADQYLYQFSFTRVDESDWSAEIAPGSSYLIMSFEGKSVQRIIKEAELPRWGANRPTIMTWVAIDDGKREMLTEASGNKGLSLLKEAAHKRGLPLILPIYDLEDSIKLPMVQLWGLFKDGILGASNRYGAESVLAGRIYKPNADTWVGNWRFYFKDNEYEYEFTSQTLDEQLLWGLSGGAKVLADAFALKPSSVKRGALVVSISKLDSLEDYGRLLNYLNKLAITKQVSLLKMKEDEAQIELTLNGTFAQLIQALSLDKKLVTKNVIKSNEGDLEEPMPNFIWQP